MAIITLITDFGTSDHYVAALKAKILSINSGLTIVDISHDVRTGDLAHSAHLLKSVYDNFPKGTIHLISVGTTGRPDEKHLALKLNEHYFIGTDNGLFGLISDNDGMAVELVGNNQHLHAFVALDILAPAAAKIASGTSFHDLGKGMSNYKKMLKRHLKATKKQISGHVIRVDHYGNLITNIDKEPFDILSKDKSFTISFGRYHARRINDYYSQVEPGDYFVVFNSASVLEIGIYQGNASQLLGLEFDSPVIINFEE